MKEKLHTEDQINSEKGFWLQVERKLRRQQHKELKFNLIDNIEQQQTAHPYSLTPSWYNTSGVLRRATIQHCVFQQVATSYV